MMTFEEYDKILAEKPGWKVYRYTFPNGKVYIGKTCRKMSERQHNKEWDGYKGCPVVYKAIKKYGIENIETTILFYGYMDEKECSEREKEMIALHKSNQREYGYNLTDGGEGICGYRFSEEARKKMGKERIGEKNHNYGKRHNEETRRKMSESLKGRIITDETRLKISKSLSGRHKSDETRKKIGEAHRGKHLSEEHRKKLSESKRGENHPFYGKHIDDERRKKISEANSKRVVCTETGVIFNSIKEAAANMGRHRSDISRCCRGILKTSGGYHWKYVEEECK